MDVNDDRPRPRRLSLEGPSPPDESGPLDELFRQLAHPTRRRVLLELITAEPGAEFDVDDLVAGPFRPRDDRIGLYHVHLPKLATAGYLDWNRRTNTVRPGSRLPTVTSAVELLVAHAHRLPGEWY